MDSGTVVPGFLCVVSPRSIPSRASAKTPYSHEFRHVLTLFIRKQEEVMVTVCIVNSPTDCPAVYESVLVRERLFPLVFAVRETGKMCENKDFFIQHEHDQAFVKDLIFCFSSTTGSSSTAMTF